MAEISLGHFAAAGNPDASPVETSSAAPLALIVFYRAWLLAADTAPVTALAQALKQRGFRTTAVFVTSLKDPAAIAPLAALIRTEHPDIILNLTAFSAGLESGGSVLDAADAPEGVAGLQPVDRGRVAVRRQLHGLRVVARGGALLVRALHARERVLAVLLQVADLRIFL